MSKSYQPTAAVRPSQLQLVLASCVALIFASTMNHVMGNPTSENPLQPLKTHATIDGGAALASELHKIYLEELDVVTKIYEKRTDPTSFSDRQISKSAGRIWKARRDAKHLELMAEPIGADLTRKLFLLAVQIDQFGLSYSRTPRGSQMITKLITKLKRDQPRFQKFLQQAATSLQKESDPNVFTKQMEAKGMEMRESLVFFSPLEQKKYLFNFEALLNAGDVRQRKQRSTQYRAEVNDRINSEVAKAAAASKEIKRICQELEDTGSVTLDGNEKASGTQAFAEICRLWAQGSANLTRANALHWMISNKATNENSSDIATLKNATMIALPSIINSLTKKTATDQIPGVYIELLRHISQLNRRTSAHNQVSQICTDPLIELVQKNPAFAGSVKAYDRATSEPLKWRSRFANEQAKSLSTQQAAAEVLLNSKSPVDASNRPNFARRPGRETLMISKTFNEPVDWMIDETAKRLVGKSIKENRLIRLAPNSQTGIIPYFNGHYANVAMSLSVEKELADLKHALLIDEGHSALSLAGMDAISSAEMQDYLSIGGVIQRVQLEALLTRFISFPDPAIALVPLGGLPQPTSNLAPLEQTCWRLDIVPQWVHHRYFTVRSIETKPQESTITRASN